MIKCKSIIMLCMMLLSYESFAQYSADNVSNSAFYYNPSSIYYETYPNTLRNNSIDSIVGYDLDY